MPPDPIDALIARASRRLTLAAAVRALGVTVTIALVAALLTRGAQKLAPIETPWVLVGPSLFAAALIGALVWAWATRRTPDAVARTIDERAGLHETLSTARWVREESSDWSGAVVGQARESARRVVLKDAVPITPPKLWPAVIAGVLTLGVWWAPSVDAAGWFAQQEEEEAQAEELERVRGEVRAAEKKIEDLLQSTEVAFEDGEGDEDDERAEGDLETPESPEALRRTAIKKLTNLRDKIEGAQGGQQAKKAEGLREAMRRLREPGPGPLNEFSRQLARGEFAAAREALQQAAEQLESSDASEDDKAQAQRQLQELARQMERLAQSREALESALQQAGATPEQAQQLAEQLSQDPSGSALENLPGIPQETLEALREMAQSQSGASEAMQGMADAMRQMAQGMEAGEGQQGMEGMTGEGLESLAQQLSQMELAQQEMRNLDAAMQEVQGQLAQMGQGLGEDGQGQRGMGEGEEAMAGDGQWWEGDSLREGQGSGGPGRGEGEGPEEEIVDFMREKRKENVANRGGPIIGSTLVFGDQVRGESTAEFSEAAAAASARAAEAIETNRVPREYEKAVQRYFGRLEARVKATQAGEDNDE